MNFEKVHDLLLLLKIVIYVKRIGVVDFIVDRTIIRVAYEIFVKIFVFEN